MSWRMRACFSRTCCHSRFSSSECMASMVCGRGMEWETKGCPRRIDRCDPRRTAGESSSGCSMLICDAEPARGIQIYIHSIRNVFQRDEGGNTSALNPGMPPSFTKRTVIDLSLIPPSTIESPNLFMLFDKIYDEPTIAPARIRIEMRIVALLIYPPFDPWSVVSVMSCWPLGFVIALPGI